PYGLRPLPRRDWITAQLSFKSRSGGSQRCPLQFTIRPSRDHHEAIFLEWGSPGEFVHLAPLVLNRAAYHQNSAVTFENFRTELSEASPAAKAVFGMSLRVARLTHSA